ncbi:TPA: hypothetical protein EYP44_01475 [Candidatus Bathyarchaeota archaeon]|nr:hypothetical protein [Candidatus Bathyarchaeota archaeon]
MVGIDNKGRQSAIDLSEAKRLHDCYFERRRRIQKKLAREPKIKGQLLTKYRGREKRRVNDLLHRASRKIAEYVADNKLEVILERLTGIRRAINRKVKRWNSRSRRFQSVSVHSKRLKRRLNSWNFRKLQSFIEYKATLNGSRAYHVDPRNTSELCFGCGGEIAPTEQSCPTCGMDRRVNACLNLLKKAQNVGISGYPEGSLMAPMRFGCRFFGDEANRAKANGRSSFKSLGSVNSLG